MYYYEKKWSKLKRFFTVVVLMAITSAISIFLYDMYINIVITTPESNAVDGGAVRLSTEIQNEEKKEDITTTLEDVAQCVVGISKIKNTGSSIIDMNSSELGLGTGMIVSDNGYIITNWHVAGNKYSTCYVTLEDGTIHNGNVVWSDSDLDLAIVKISVNGLDYLDLGDSDNVKLGQEVYAIGNPIGIEFQRTVTAGIISGVNRTIKIEEEEKLSYMEDLIQTDATINPGNSGGPLINSSGEILGINSVKIASAEGIGFAVPINSIKPVIESYITTNDFQEAYLGIFAYDKEVIPYLNSSLEFNSGIYVIQVSADGPATNSGLKIGDIITKIDDVTINKMSELRDYIYRKKPNDVVVLTINRNNKTQTINVTLGKQ